MLLHFKQFSLPYTLFEACGAVFIVNSKIHLWKISCISKPIWHYFGVNSISRLTADQCGTEQRWNRPVFDSASFIWSIGHINRRGKNQFIVGFPRCNMNYKGTDHDVRERQGFDGKKPNVNTLPKNKHIPLDLSSRNGTNCSNVICKMLLRSKLTSD